MKERNAPFDTPRAASHSPALIRPEAPASEGVSSSLTSFGPSGAQGSGGVAVSLALGWAGPLDALGSGATGAGAAGSGRDGGDEQAKPIPHTNVAPSIFIVLKVRITLVERSSAS